MKPAIKDEPPDKRYHIRQQNAVPVINKMKTWLDKSIAHVLPSSKMGEALAYLHNQWDRLTAYVNASANLYSLIETAKANGVNPYEYLKHVFTRLPNMTTKDSLEDMMPWSCEIG